LVRPIVPARPVVYTIKQQCLTFDGSELSSLGVSTLVDLAIGSVAHHFDQVEDASRVLKQVSRKLTVKHMKQLTEKRIPVWPDTGK
jgi:hypothetical protein